VLEVLLPFELVELLEDRLVHCQASVPFLAARLVDNPHGTVGGLQLLNLGYDCGIKRQERIVAALL
jgi:hypothetical protein